MALTKIGKEGITGISNSADATFLTATSGEGVTLAGTLAVTGVHTVGNNAIFDSEGGAVTQNLVQGLLKAWANLDGSGTVGVNDSFNTTGITDNGTGNYTVTIANDLANANGCMSGYSIMDGLVYGDSSNVSSAGTFQMRLVLGYNNALFDPDEFHVQIAGDLA